MLYKLEQGGDEADIIEQALANGFPIPDYILNAPELFEGLLIYLMAFFRLSSGRPVSFGPGKISWLQIEEYCDRFGFDYETRDIMHFHVRTLDNAYLEWSNKKAKTE